MPAISPSTIKATTLTGTLSTAAQPNVTSVGTLTSLTVSGLTTHTKTGESVLFSGAGTGAQYTRMTSTGADFALGVSSSVGTGIIASGNNYSTVLATLGATALVLGTNSTAAITISSAQAVTLANGLTVSAGTTAVQALTATTVAATGAMSGDTTLQVDGNVGFGTTDVATYPLRVRRAGGAGSVAVTVDNIWGSDRDVRIISLPDTSSDYAGIGMYWQNNAGSLVLGLGLTRGSVIVGTMASTNATLNTLALTNATAPSANPTGGGFLYVESGALKYRGSSGTVTTIANA